MYIILNRYNRHRKSKYSCVKENDYQTSTNTVGFQRVAHGGGEMNRIWEVLLKRSRIIFFSHDEKPEIISFWFYTFLALPIVVFRLISVFEFWYNNICYAVLNYIYVLKIKKSFKLSFCLHFIKVLSIFRSTYTMLSFKFFTQKVENWIRFILPS